MTDESRVATFNLTPDDPGVPIAKIQEARYGIDISNAEQIDACLEEMRKALHLYDEKPIMRARVTVRVDWFDVEDLPEKEADDNA